MIDNKENLKQPILSFEITISGPKNLILRKAALSMNLLFWWEIAFLTIKKKTPKQLLLSYDNYFISDIHLYICFIKRPGEIA